MKRLTKSEIERLLLAGSNVPWQDISGREHRLALADAKQRRLFAYILSTDVRQPTGLSQAFINGLSIAYEASDDPALATAVSSADLLNSRQWRLKSLETRGFGGLNSWRGGPFRFDFDGESLLLEGPNGSGKSSLVSAIVWALSGERPRDQAEARAEEPRPVFTANKRPAGDWPPIATYPPNVADLQSPPRVHVRLTFEDSDGSTANVERSLQGGSVTSSIDSAFTIPLILIETGLLMPARFARLRLDDGRGRLTDAVQQLTGLNDLVAIGKLAEGLCHKSREYRSYGKKDLASARTQFDEALVNARTALEPVKENVQSFLPKDTNDSKGQMATFGKMLNERAAELTRVISSDLAEGLDLSRPKIQHRVIAAIAAAKNDIDIGLGTSRTWRLLQSIAQAFDQETSEEVKSAIASAHAQSEEALRLLKRANTDSRFQLKALAAKWHSDHVPGAVEDCPLCEQRLTDLPTLAHELEALQELGGAAARTFADNLNAILADLEKAVPVVMRNIETEVPKHGIRGSLLNELRNSLVLKDQYANCLTRFGMLVSNALSSAPQADVSFADKKPTPVASEELKRITKRIAFLEKLLALAEWFAENSAAWSAWWKSLANLDTSQTAGRSAEKRPPSDAPEHEGLSVHIARLSDALTTAEPYRHAASAMRTAWTAGKTAAHIEKEVNRRDAIAQNLAALKSLGALCEAIARNAIDGLSGRISTVLGRIHLTEQLQFQSAELERKEGLVVRGALAPDLQIDATLVANTSWVRAVLWAFLFSLREEAVEQLGSDPFPLLVVDDPQSTFDAQHRHMWALYVVSLQNEPSKVQLLLTTHDENFLGLVKVDGITGRQALIGSPGPNGKHVDIFEGEALDRDWDKAVSANSPVAGVSYMEAVRKYVEGMMKLMLRGQDADIPSLVLGKLRDRLNQYHTAQSAPWNQAAFKKLLGTLDSGCAEIRFIEGSHHTTGQNYGMGEATSVEEFWRKKLRPRLDRAFRTAREHRLVHGGLSALQGSPPVATLPEGYQEKVRAIPLTVLGRAAALSDGRAADGAVDMDQFAAEKEIPVTLGRHFAYRLTASTLEPVARAGDIVLVKEHGEPSQKSLALAISEDRILARRFEIAENHTDVAVLTAQATNPRQIAPPVIANRATFKLHKIVGVLYDDWTGHSPPDSNAEVCNCGGEAALRHFAVDTLGLVEVAGQSAEPYALDGQYLIVGNPISSHAEMKSLQDRPVIAVDSDSNYYFKRLRNVADDSIVLESLDSSGTHGPVLLSPPGGEGRCLDKVWQVAGVLFETN